MILDEVANGSMAVEVELMAALHAKEDAYTIRDNSTRCKLLADHASLHGTTSSEMQIACAQKDLETQIGKLKEEAKYKQAMYIAEVQKTTVSSWPSSATVSSRSSSAAVPSSRSSSRFDSCRVVVTVSRSSSRSSFVVVCSRRGGGGGRRRRRGVSVSRGKTNRTAAREPK